jgi:hypothetical protein
MCGEVQSLSKATLHLVTSNPPLNPYFESQAPIHLLSPNTKREFQSTSEAPIRLVNSNPPAGDAGAGWFDAC